MKKMNRSTILIHGFTMIVLTFSTPSYSTKSNYDISCGIAQESGDTFKIVKTGTSVPFITIDQNPDYTFGCTVTVLDTSKSTNNKFSLYAEITPPNASIKTYTSNIGHTNQPSGKKLVIKTDLITFSEAGNNKTGYVVFRLHESDDTGEYSVSVYINDKLEKIVVFNVTK